MDFLDDFLKSSSNTSGEAVVSGTNVEQETEVVDLNDLMANINSENVKLQQSQDAEAASASQAEQEADRKAREEARAKWMAEKAEKERIERERILAEQKAEEERLAAELAAKQQNPFNKLAGIFKKKNDDSDDNNAESAVAEKISDTEQEEPAAKNEKDASTKYQSAREKDSEKKNAKMIEEKKTPKKTKSEKFVNERKGKQKEVSSNNSEEKPDFEYLATHDSLTKLLNRTAFDMRISTASAENLTVIFFDINNLKKTNDTYGHEFGNKLITATASKLNELFTDNVYRIGGDEFIVLVENIGTKVVERRIDSIREYLNRKTTEDKDGLVYAVAVGYAVGDGQKTIMQLQEEADKAMYADKAKYKKDHPELNGRPEEIPKEQPENYDELLSKEQRELKEIIKEGHVMADEDKTERILMEIQSRYQEVLAIFVADADFNSLYIIRDVRNFLAMASEMEDTIDYSYFYVVYEGGPQYYGTDDYMTEVTHIFEEITSNLTYNRSINSKELAKIPGINIFKNIYFDC